MTEETAARLREVLAGIDLGRADGRIGIGVMLAEIERVAPQAILQSAARVQLRALGVSAGVGVDADVDGRVGRGDGGYKSQSSKLAPKNPVDSRPVAKETR
jgi:hypothetical protein